MRYRFLPLFTITSLVTAISPIALSEECPSGSGCDADAFAFDRGISPNSVDIEVSEESHIEGSSESDFSFNPPPSVESSGVGPADIVDVPPVAQQGSSSEVEAGPAPEVLQSPSPTPGPSALAPTGRYDLQCEAREGFSFHTGLCMRDRPAQPDTSSPLLYSGGHISEEPKPYDYEKYGVDTRTLIRRASRTISVPGAGLRLNPRGKGWTSIPILLRAETPVHTINATMFGRTIPVTFKARVFSYEFHDGTEPLVTEDPGAPYPYMELQHIYHKANPAQTITLRTTWDATCTNPWTGETLTIPRSVVTVETSDPFPVKKLHTYLTDTAEEEAGH